MCGIVGILDPGREQWPERPFDLDLMRHRGPDDRGQWTTPGLALGHLRLAILDLSEAGHQPFLSEDGRHALVFNGEIYNYRELRTELMAAGHRFHTATDTEVLLVALRQWGEAALPRLWGMFAFALWDTREKSLLLARDRFGEKPLYFHRDGARLCFASELKMLLGLLREKPAMDPVQLDRYLHHGYIPEPGCLLQGIEKVPPGGLLKIPLGKTPEVRRWWHFNFQPDGGGDPIDRLDAALAGAAERCLRSDVPVGISLSGGLDSSALAVLASKKHSREVSAISIGYPGEPDNDESVYARSLAAELGMPFKRVLIEPQDCLDGFARMVRAMDEPVGDVAAFAYHQVARASREHAMPVLLSGIGGDELFWGYTWVQQAVQLSQKKRAEQGTALAGLLSALGGRLANLKPGRQLARNHSTPAFIKDALAAMRAGGQLHLDEPRWYPFDELQNYFNESALVTSRLYSSSMAEVISPATRMQAWGLDAVADDDLPAAVLRLLFDGWLGGNCLLLGDRLSMDWSVELRLPLLEAGLVETVAGLSPLRDGYSAEPKALFKEVLRRHLPSEVIDRPKRGFSPPSVDWTRRLYDRHAGDLAGGRVAATGYFEPRALAALIHGVRESNRNLNFIYRLLVLEIWMREVLN